MLFVKAWRRSQKSDPVLRLKFVDPLASARTSTVSAFGGRVLLPGSAVPLPQIGIDEPRASQHPLRFANAG
jgi:hypothetical protein